MADARPTLRIAVLADLRPGAEGPASPQGIDRERYDEVLSAWAPELQLEVPDCLADGPDRVVQLRFERWRDLSPAGVVAAVPELARAHALLEQLTSGSYDPESAASEAEGLAPESWREALRRGAEAAPTAATRPPAPESPSGGSSDGGGVDAILDLVDSPGGEAKSRDTARRLVEDLSRRPPRSSGAPPPTQLSVELAERLGAQLDAILHAPGFRALERAWAGLRWLLSRTNPREDIEVAVVAAPIDAAAGALAGLDTGPDFDLVIAAYEYDASPRDFERVSALAGAGEVLQSVVVTGLAPGFFGVDGWDALRRGESPRALFGAEAHAAWRSLREKEASRWLVLVANRLALRGRYGPEGESTRGLAYQEAAPGGLLASAAWAVGANLARSWERTRAPVQLSGTRHGLVQDLPLLALGDEPSPVEGRFGNERREDLESIGITALQHYRRDVAFLGAVRCFRAPERYPDADATADAAQQVSLAYQILASRLVKLLGRVVPELVGLERDTAAETLRARVVAHFSRPGQPLGPDHVGVELDDDADDPELTIVGLRVQPEIQVGGRPVNILLRFGVRL